jgi:hypothetical protein
VGGGNEDSSLVSRSDAEVQGAPQPDTTEPDTTEPDTTEPDTTEPDGDGLLLRVRRFAGKHKPSVAFGSLIVAALGLFPQWHGIFWDEGKKPPAPSVNIQIQAPTQTPIPTPTPTPTPTPKQYDASSLPSMLNGLGSPSPTTRANTLAVLKLAVRDPSLNAELRHTILDRLVSYVKEGEHYVAPGPGSFDYCLKPPRTKYPPDLDFALQILGKRLAVDYPYVIDLSGVNLGYATMINLDFENARFDNATLCRTLMFGTNFTGASFNNADLRFSPMIGAVGLTEDQLTRAYTLFKVSLPKYLDSSRILTHLKSVDPEL